MAPIKRHLHQWKHPFNANYRKFFFFLNFIIFFLSKLEKLNCKAGAGLNLITASTQANYDQTQLKQFSTKEHICKESNQLSKLSCQTTSY